MLVNGIPLVVQDTAGIRQTTDEIEQIGIERSLSSMEQAEIIVALFDLSRPFDADDALICKKITGKQCILVGNKSDLPQKFDVTELLDRLDTEAPSSYGRAVWYRDGRLGKQNTGSRSGETATRRERRRAVQGCYHYETTA